MTERTIRISPTANVEPCSTCGNRTDFKIRSQQSQEDGCEVWAACKCGLETTGRYRAESVMGGVGNQNVGMAMLCWNDFILAGAKPEVEYQ